MTQKEVCEFIKTALELVGFKSATIVFRNNQILKMDCTGKMDTDAENIGFDNRILDAVNFTENFINGPVKLNLDGVYLVTTEQLKAYPFFRSTQEISEVTGKSLSCINDFINAYVPKFGTRSLRYTDVRLYVGCRYLYLKERRQSGINENLDGLIALTSGHDPYTRLNPYLQHYMPFSRDPKLMTMDQLAKLFKISQSAMRHVLRDTAIEPKTPEWPKLYNIEELSVRLAMQPSPNDKYNIMHNCLDYYIESLQDKQPKEKTP